MNTLHVDVGLARYSDWAFTSAVVALVVALLLLAFELAYVGARRVDHSVAVSAGSVAADSTVPGIVENADQRPFDEFECRITHADRPRKHRRPTDHSNRECWPLPPRPSAEQIRCKLL